MYKMMWINTGETRKGGEFVGKEQRSLLTKPSKAAPGTRPTAKHMLQRATRPLPSTHSGQACRGWSAGRRGPQPGAAVSAFNLSFEEAETRGSLSLGPAWSTHRVPG